MSQAQRGGRAGWHRGSEWGEVGEEVSARMGSWTVLDAHGLAHQLRMLTFPPNEAFGQRSGLI